MKTRHEIDGKNIVKIAILQFSILLQMKMKEKQNLKRQ